MPTLPKDSITQAKPKSLQTHLASLVSLPTISSDTSTCRVGLDWIKAELSGLPLIVSDVEYNGHPGVIFSTRKTMKPKVMLLAHLDVVPAPVEMFTLKKKDGKYLGRGVFDMKGVIAAYILLLQSLGSDLPNYNLSLAITADEETSENNTATEIVRLGWHPEVVVNPDAIPDWLMERASKGRLHYRIGSVGTAGHGSRPWLYRNAISQLMAFLTNLEALFPLEENCTDPQHQHSTYSVNIIRGGTVFNQIPDSAEAEIEFRVMPDQSYDEVDAIIRRLAARHEYITITHITSKISSVTDPTNEYIQEFRKIIKKVTGHVSTLAVSHGSSDSEFFTAVGIPTITTGPPGGGHHSGREWVSVEGLEQLYQILMEFTTLIAKT